MKHKWYALKLVLVCVIIYILQVSFLYILQVDAADYLGLISSDVLLRSWTIITYIFLHSATNPMHLIFNMIALALFGTILEKIIGSKKFLLIFFISGLISGIGSIFFYWGTIGASGAIYGVLGALAVLRPRMRVFIGYVPMPMFVAAFAWAIIDFVGLIAPTNVANAGHLLGLLFGIIIGLYLRKEFGERVVKRKTKDIDEKEFREWEERWMKRSFERYS